MLATKTILLSLAISWPIWNSVTDEGQGTAKPGSTIEQLQMGSFVYGATFDSNDTLGKIIVVEIGGG